MEEYMLWGQPDAPGRSAAELVQGLEQTWVFIDSHLQRWTPAECAETFPEEGQTYEVSHKWVILHVLEYDLHHGSKVSLILVPPQLKSVEWTAAKQGNKI